MTRHEALLKMIRLVGGMSKAAEQLGYTRDALSNRVYGRKGQQLHDDDILDLQALSSQCFYAEAFAADSGGVFVKLPEISEMENEELLTKWNALYSKVGEFSRVFSAAIEDEEVDRKERADLVAIGNKVNKLVQELLALTFRIYCRGSSGAGSQ